MPKAELIGILVDHGLSADKAYDCALAVEDQYHLKTRATADGRRCHLKRFLVMPPEGQAYLNEHRGKL